MYVCVWLPALRAAAPKLDSTCEPQRVHCAYEVATAAAAAAERLKWRTHSGATLALPLSNARFALLSLSNSLSLLRERATLCDLSRKRDVIVCANAFACLHQFRLLPPTPK